MNDIQKTKYRYFFLSFSIAFVGLSLLFFGMMSAASPSRAQSASYESAGVETTSYVPVREDALSVLFVGVAPDSSEADTFILARFDPARGKVPVVVFPRETAVDNNGKTETIAEVYKYGGADYARQALSRTLGIAIDRYVRMDVNAFVVAAGTVGTVEFDLSHELVLESGGVTMTLAKGMQLLDGATAAEIIHYGGYGGELVRCAVVGDLTAAIVNQRIDIVLSTMVDKVFEKIINLIDTDISYADYDDRKQAAEFLARLGQEPAVAVAVSGEYNEEGSLYTLADTFIALLTQTFV